eukprot:jgi/Hompol1/2706/HPOL_005923-RA
MAASAWNAVITGAKKWVMFPPEIIPPGVFPSSDGSEVTSPVSLAEWFMNWYHETAGDPSQRIECVCRAGEILFVPNGWWHCVMNIEDSIALTQNFVNSENLVNVLDFAEFRPEQVSGFSCDHGGLYKEFTEELARSKPHVLEAAQAVRSKRTAAQRRAVGARGSMALRGDTEKDASDTDQQQPPPSAHPASFWSLLSDPNQASSEDKTGDQPGFSFSFSVDTENE